MYYSFLADPTFYILHKTDYNKIVSLSRLTTLSVNKTIAVYNAI